MSCAGGVLLLVAYGILVHAAARHTHLSDPLLAARLNKCHLLHTIICGLVVCSERHETERNCGVHQQQINPSNCVLTATRADAELVVV